MALADYRLCDLCECKTFYDAELNYDFSTNLNSNGDLLPSGNVGDMKVICKKCAVENIVVIMKK